MAGARLTLIAFFSGKPLLKTPPETGRCLAKPKKMDQTFNLNLKCVLTGVTLENKEKME